MNFNFDMDGTLVDFYGVPNWLKSLEAEDTAPYKEAKPLVNFSQLAKTIHVLQKMGHQVNIISWTPKSGSKEFQKEIEKVKKEYLKKHLPSVHFDKISIIPYGTPKSKFGDGILFDDELKNREEWGLQAFNEKQIFKVLKQYKEG